MSTTSPADQEPIAPPRIPWTQVKTDFLRGVVPLAIVAASFGIYSVFGNRPAPERRADTGPREATVITVPTEAYRGTIDIAVEGVVKPFRYLTLAAEVAGRIQYKAPECQEATHLSKGTLLFEIDPTDYELALERISRQLEQTEIAIREWAIEKENLERQIALSEDDVALAGREVARLRGLSRGISTATELDQSRRAEITARNQLVALTNQRRLLESRYERAVTERDLQRVLQRRAERDLARTKVFAPCDGTVISENVEQDGYVRQGETLVVINDTSLGEVVCQVELSDLFWLWGTKSLTRPPPGDPPADETSTPSGTPEAAIDDQQAFTDEVYAFPEWPVRVEFAFQDLVCHWQGRWTRFGGTGIDPATRTVPCQLTVTNPRRGELKTPQGTPVTVLPPPPLTIGMFVTVHSQVTPFVPLLSLPSTGIRPGATVWVVRDGKLHTLPVRLARRMGDRTLLYQDPDGLRAGDRVVTSPLALVQEGMPVREVDP